MNAGNALLAATLQLIDAVLGFYVWALIISAVISWLTAFGVINNHNRFVRGVAEFLYRITEPLLRPIRRVLPDMGGLDLAPMVLILIVWFLQSFIRHLVF